MFDAFYGLSDVMIDNMSPLDLQSDRDSLIALAVKIDRLRERERKTESGPENAIHLLAIRDHCRPFNPLEGETPHLPCRWDAHG